MLRRGTRAARRRCAAALVLAAVAALAASAGAAAAAPAPHWSATIEAIPTYIEAGDEHAAYRVRFRNDGGATTAPASPFSVTVQLPAGTTATTVVDAQAERSIVRLECPAMPAVGSVTCVSEPGGSARPGEVFTLLLNVAVPLSAPSSLTATATISGGGAPGTSASVNTPVTSTPAPFGATFLTSDLVDEGGDPDAQAGSHPYELTTDLTFNIAGREPPTEVSPFEEPLATAAARDIEVALPPGLVGNPQAVPSCPQRMFRKGNIVNCPLDTQVGNAFVYFFGTGTRQDVPIYNIEPPPDQPAELGMMLAFVGHVEMFFHLRSDGDYGLTAQLANLPESGPPEGAIVTLWGVPAAPIHDEEREGLISESPEVGCLGSKGKPCPSGVAPEPFLTLPTECQEAPLPLLLKMESWQRPEPSAPFVPAASLPGPSGCGALSFTPALAVAPDSAQPGAPAGYDVSVHLPQDEQPSGLATPDVRRAVVTLPAGTVPSPSAANGLQACSDEQFARRSLGEAECPAASQIGTVTVTTPLLAKPLVGEAFLGAPQCAPCSAADAQEGRMLRLFLQVKGPGVIVKLEGATSVNQGDGQLTTTFDNAPQLPFEDLHVVLDGGPRAPLANPQQCGQATSTADLTAWSAPATPDATPASTFEVVGCPPQQPFRPTLQAGTVSNGAASSSTFVTSVARPDGDQALSQVSLRLPPGLIGDISSVTPCPEPQASVGACPPSSLIGHLDATVGAGPLPLHIPQVGRAVDPVYLTAPYKGAPFGLSIPVAAEAGPFDLGTIVVRGSVAVDPNTAQVTVTTDPLPQARDGIPLQLRVATVTIDRTGFMRNPTDCEPLALAATVAGAGGALAPLSSRFQASNCGLLAFKPRLTASTSAHTSRLNGASLDVQLHFPTGAEANVRSVKVDLPSQLPSRLTTLQKACPAQVFAANPAACPAASVVGIARAQTPVLPVLLAGPVYLVSHGGEAFPNVVAVLQGDGIRVDLTGHTLIRRGITSSDFASVPDVPVSSFELYLPQGRFSALTAHGSLCLHRLKMPTRITGQNGAVTASTTAIHVNGCPAKQSRRKRSARGRQTARRKRTARR